MNAIEINDLRKEYKNFNLKINNLKIESGFITGFIGPNGAGKTTTIKSIMGMSIPNEGDIKIFGRDILKDAKVKEEIGYVGENSGFLEESSLKIIRKNIAMFYSKWDKDVYNYLIKEFNLNENSLYKELSKGMKKQFELAVALAHHPKLLIMDEPTANLDPVVRNTFLEILQEFMEKEDLTIFYSTHVTSDLDKCSDFIVFINNGKILLSGVKDEIIDNHTIIKGKNSLLDEETKKEFISIKESSFGFEGMSANRGKAYEVFGEEVIYEKPNLEDIMLYYNRRG